jgi:hypothetical protein
MQPEIEEARNNRIEAAINRNVTEFSKEVEGLVPGMNGQQILNQFILAPKYGGSELDRMFAKDHPEAKGLPEAERVKVTQEWFRNFQTDRAAMAHVAEFGRLRWQVEQFKPILEHAQMIGAGKVANSREAGIGRPSPVLNGQRAVSGNSKMENFFSSGYDSVN